MPDPSAREDRLRAALRQGDPLGEGDPTPAEARNLRARLLLAAGQRAPGAPPSWLAGRWPALLATACVAVIAAVAGWSWFGAPAPHRNATAASQHAPAVLAPQPSSSHMAAAGDSSTGPASPSVPPAADRSTTRSDPRTLGPSDRSARPAADERRPRQIHFITPGGTRIVWVLNPNFSLAPGAPQQEDPRWSGE